MIIISRISIFMGNFWSKNHKEGHDWIPTTLLFSSFHVVGMGIELRFASVFMHRDLFGKGVVCEDCIVKLFVIL